MKAQDFRALFEQLDELAEVQGSALAARLIREAGGVASPARGGGGRHH